MLRVAKFYEEELTAIHNKCMRENPDKYKDLRNASYSQHSIRVDDSDDRNVDRVSVDRYGSLLGFISATIERDCNIIVNVYLMSFTDRASIVFAKDCLLFIEQLRENYSIIRFNAIAGTKAEELWQRTMRKLGGREVGRFTNDSRLTDHRIRDTVFFEIPGYIK